MEATFILLMLVTAVASRNVPKAPKPDYVPSPELLDSIFNPSVSDKPVENPFEVAPDTDDNIQSGKKHSNDDETKDHTVEVNVKIHVGADCDKDRVSIKEDIKLNGIANTTQSGGAKQEKNKKANVKVTSRFVDRVALGADSCASGMVRVGNTCSTED